MFFFNEGFPKLYLSTDQSPGALHPGCAAGQQLAELLAEARDLGEERGRGAGAGRGRGAGPAAARGLGLE